MSRLARIFVALIFAAWLATPLVLIAFGAESRFAALEKRRPAKPPELSAAAILDSGFYADLADYFSDRVPLRARAVTADSWIELNVFGDSPNPEVLLGAGGWLFSRESTLSACGKKASPLEVVTNVRRLDRILGASGRRFIFLVAPNKEAIYPEYLGPAASLAQCARDFRQELRPRLEQATLAAYIDLWQALESLKERSDRDIYWPHDTHWTPEAALEVTRRLVERLDPRLWEESQVVVRPGGSHRGDLSDMLGLPVRKPAVAHRINRGVEVKSRGGQFRRTSVNGEAFPGRVAIIDDSFGRTYRESLAQFLGAATWINSRNSISKRYRAAMAREIAGADVVILELVERSLATYLVSFWRDLHVRLVGDLLVDLPAVELDLGRVLKSAQPSRVDLDLPAAAPGVVRYLVADLEAQGRRPSLLARLPGERWHNVRSVELSAETESRRFGAQIPIGARVAIRWGAVRAAWLVDIPG